VAVAEPPPIHLQQLLVRADRVRRGVQGEEDVAQVVQGIPQELGVPGAAAELDGAARLGQRAGAVALLGREIGRVAQDLDPERDGVLREGAAESSPRSISFQNSAASASRERGSSRPNSSAVFCTAETKRPRARSSMPCALSTSARRIRISARARGSVRSSAVAVAMARSTASTTVAGPARGAPGSASAKASNMNARMVSARAAWADARLAWAAVAATPTRSAISTSATSPVDTRFRRTNFATR
jgi:hypothetical protein